MDIRIAVTLAGGPCKVALECGKISHVAVIQWCKNNRFPRTEWTGETKYASIICDMVKTNCHKIIHPITLCRGAGQYIQPGGESVEKNDWTTPLPLTMTHRVIAACMRNGIDPAPFLDADHIQEAT